MLLNIFPSILFAGKIKNEKKMAGNPHISMYEGDVFDKATI
jgi:hypothetical protein